MLQFDHPISEQRVSNKNGRAAPLLAALGLSHVGISSSSADPPAGNSKPRFVRIPEAGSVVANYGLPKEGADRVAR